MDPKNNEVKKNIDPQALMTQLSNMGSQIDTIKQQLAGGEMGDPAAAQAAAAAKAKDEDGSEKTGEQQPEKEEDLDGKKAKKEIVNTPSDSATSNDKAEDKIVDNLPDLTEENVDEVAKTLAFLRKTGIITDATVAKSAKLQEIIRRSENSTNLGMMKTMADAVTGLADRVADIAKAQGHMLKSSGITEQLEVAEKAAKEKEIVEKANADDPNLKFQQELNAKLELISKSQGGSTPLRNEQPLSQGDHIRKTLSDEGTLAGFISGGRTNKITQIGKR